MITREAAEIVTDVFKNRWHVSVDDLMETSWLFAKISASRTYILFLFIDHGFQLGQNNILMDKRHV